METILFDLDDTLIESMHVWEDAIIRLFKKMDLYMSMEEARQIFFTMKFSEVLTYIKERFHTKQDEAWMFNEVNEDILNQYAYHIEAKKGALDYIKKCASENKKMAVLTSNTRALSEKVLDRLGMLEYMENVYSADELKMSKREVDIYEYVLKDLNTTAESAIVFEDSMYAINTARSLNIECIGLVNPNGSLTLAHSRNSQMSFMYGFFFRQIFALYCCMCCNCDIIVVKDGCFYETVL